MQVNDYVRKVGFRYCLIGGIALQRWGQPRTTLDVNVTVMTGFGNEKPAIETLLGWLKPRVPDAAEFAQHSRVLLAVTDDGVGVDVSLGAIPFESRMMDRASPWRLNDGRTLLTCSAEDLIVQKVFAGRDQDWVDVGNVVCRQRDSIDRQLVLQEVAPLLELKGDTDSITRWLSQLDRHSGS